MYSVYVNRHSWITLAPNDPRPLYLQIIEQIERRVGVGDLPPGTELPSIRQLAAELQVSVITVKRAYLELEHSGTIVTRQGKGSVVSDRPGLRESVQEKELNGEIDRVVGLGLVMGISKTEMQRRIGEAYDRSQGKK